MGLTVTTQEFLVFICHSEPQLNRCHSEPQLKGCHMFNPHLEPQHKGYVPSHNSRNTSKLTLKVSPKYCRSRTTKANKAFNSVVSPGATLEPLGETRF